MLYFDPRTGTNVRVETNRTRELRRVAPRVVMFGITNACNLDCAFCSRDSSHKSLWTLDAATRVLSDLARAGTLEVAFGGGEPFVFRHFETLLLTLRDETSLALNVTTNGTLLTREKLARLRGVLGQVRVSIYDDVSWRDAAVALSTSGQRWGANLLVNRTSLRSLDARLGELAAFGARDVSILSYVGPEASMHLTSADDVVLSEMIAASPLPTRVSVCFGRRLGLPVLFDGADGTGDCGAGRDFISITSNKEAHSCSFHDTRFPIETAEDVLRVWRSHAAALATPSLRNGCARNGLRIASEPGERPRLQLWQAFSGNNSGECVMVAKFETVQSAEAYLAELLPGYVPSSPHSAPWLELFRQEHLVLEQPAEDEDIETPDELVQVGTSVLAHTRMALLDSFAEIRALAWKRGAQVLPGGVHLHSDTGVLFAIRAVSSADAQAIARTPVTPTAIQQAHGGIVVGFDALHAFADPKVRDFRYWRDVAHASELLRTFAGTRPLSLELYYEGRGWFGNEQLPLVVAEDLREVLKRLGTDIEKTPRLTAQFYGHPIDSAVRRAVTFAESVDSTQGHASVIASRQVLVDPVHAKKRLAVIGLRQGAVVNALTSSRVRIEVTVSITRARRANAPEVVAERAASVNHIAELVRSTNVGTVIEAANPESGSITLTSAEPSEVLGEIYKYACGDPTKAEDAGVPHIWCQLSDVDPLGLAVRRLIEEVSAR